MTITVRVNNQTAAGFRDIDGRLRTMDGRFAGTARQADIFSKSMVGMKATLLSLAPAAVPVAASLAPIAVKAGAAGVAVAAFGAAVVPQIANLKNAADAQDKYTAAVTKYGAGSKQAVQAQQFVADTLKSMPAATQRAAAAYSNLRDSFHSFSDSTAKFTMAPVEHSFAVLGAIIPKLTPMVAATSTQLDRLVKVAGGAVNTAGFDALSKKVSDFANSSLKNATDSAIHFIRVMSEGNAKGPISEFMAYAKAEGPAVKELLSNLVQALGNIAKGASEAGPGMLSLVNAFAKLVAVVPPQLIGNLMQVYAAVKLIKLAGAGVGVVAGGFATLAGKVAALQAASVAAGGGLAGLKAAFLSLGTTARASVVVAGIAALALVLTKLASIGKSAPPDVDRMTTAITNLGRSGKVSGEALRVYGANLGGLADSLRTLSRPSNLDKVQQFLVSLVGMDSTPVAKAKDDLDGVDKALANMVKGGHADLAKVAFNDLAKAMEKQGLTGKELKGKLDDYKSALADQALEQKLAAQSMGLFGDAAQKTSAKLDAQKASADGLRQSIQALNDVNRQGLGGMIAFNQAISDAADAAKKNAGALSMNHGVLDLSSQKARDAASALQDLADKTDSAAASARESGSNWETVNGIYSKGRSALIKNAEAMGLSASQAKQLASQILKIPDKTAKVKMNTEDAIAGVNAFNSALKRTPGAKSVTLKTLSSSAEQALQAFGYKVQHLKDGRVRVSAATGSALSQILNVSRAISSLNGKTATTYVITKTSTTGGSVYHEGGKYARGGRIRGYAAGGGVQAFPDGGYVQGPGSGTSDSILGFMGSGAVAAVSNTEYVVKAAAVRKYGVKMMDAINEGRLPVAHLAKGGMSQAMKDARGQLGGSFGISSFGRMAGYQRTPFERSLGAPSNMSSLVSALNSVAGQIRAAFNGHTESSLLHRLSSVGKSLIGYEKQLNSVTRSLASAKDKLNSLKDASSQLASSVKSGILSSANITSGTSGTTPTVASIMGGLTDNRDKAVAFADALKQLKAKGLSASLIQQIGEAGISGGGLETAGALLGASPSEISSLNSLQGQINSAAGSAGKTTADSVYAKAIKDQTATVNKLTHQQERLEKAMASLAKTMEKLISKALKGKASGGIVGAAASGGLRSDLTWVGEHGPELLDLPAGSRVWSNPDSRRKLAEAQAPWASMLNSSRRAAAPAGGFQGPAGREPIVLEIRAGDGGRYSEFLARELRQFVRVRGGNVQVAIMGRSS
ncbi:phage tail protein [Streptomyces sp. NPDC051987]|uniref:phage tail protein n=1 Tax=Streptomyces sp. NPDC051987 TaxID=3155808 RepID=UPI0034362A6B